MKQHSLPNSQPRVGAWSHIGHAYLGEGKAHFGALSQGDWRSGVAQLGPLNIDHDCHRRAHLADVLDARRKFFGTDM